MDDRMNREPVEKSLERIERLMAECRIKEASDLHLSSDKPPYLRRHGNLCRMEEDEVITAAELRTLARALMNDRQWEAFLKKSTIDIARTSREGTRFRINVYHQHGGIAIALRKLEDRLGELRDWNLPETLDDLAEFRDGLVIVTGPTGSGKTTTLAVLLNRIARNRACHIITVEDPVEFLYESSSSLIHQRELYTDVPSFAEAIRSSMREDPDVLLVGEMRDLDTMRAGITAAETGHLVFSTLHTGDAVGSIERMLGMFPAVEQDSIRHQLSMVLRSVVAQKLLLDATGEGRLPAVEILKVNSAVSHLIRSGRTEQLYSLMESGSSQGMRTLEQDLARLVSSGKIQLKAAQGAARNTEILEEWLRNGRRRTAAARSGRT
jgi:twitching motility protein PilT